MRGNIKLYFGHVRRAAVTQGVLARECHPQERGRRIRLKGAQALALKAQSMA